MTFPLALCFFCCFGLGFGVFALSRKARTWGGDDVTTPITFCSNCTPLLFNASLHIDLERSSSKAVTLLDNGCGLTILAILFLFSLCVSKKIGLFPLFSRRRRGGVGRGSICFFFATLGVGLGCGGGRQANERQADFLNKTGFLLWPGFRFYWVLEATVKVNSRYSIARGCLCV